MGHLPSLTFPNLKSALVPLSLLGFIWTFNMFNVIYLLTDGAPIFTSVSPAKRTFSSPTCTTLRSETGVRGRSGVVGGDFHDASGVLVDVHETDQCNGGHRMISQETVRRWYTPVEVSTLRRWLLVSVVVNVICCRLTHSEGESFLIGVLGVIAIGPLNSLPEEQILLRATKHLCWGVRCCCVGWFGCSPRRWACLTSGCTWMLGPGALTILWVSGRPVSAWSTRGSPSVPLNTGWQETNPAPRLQAFGSHWSCCISWCSRCSRWYGFSTSPCR